MWYRWEWTGYKPCVEQGDKRAGQRAGGRLTGGRCRRPGRGPRRIYQVPSWSWRWSQRPPAEQLEPVCDGQGLVRQLYRAPGARILEG